jgi:hypothetical protein
MVIVEQIINERPLVRKFVLKRDVIPFQKLVVLQRATEDVSILEEITALNKFIINEITFE